jgi:hypothetical protein
MIRINVWMKLLTSVLLAAGTAFPQSSDRLPATDAEKIADALRAGPGFITKDATVLDWPSSPGGEYARCEDFWNFIYGASGCQTSRM